jgi:hypothetical protein
MLEFLLIFSMAIVIGVLYLAIGTSMFVDASEQQRREAIDEVGYLIQDELILASSVTDGYSRTFLVPAKADRFTYTMTQTPTSVALASGTINMTYTLPLHDGTLNIGQNVVRARAGAAGGVEVNP